MTSIMDHFLPPANEKKKRRQANLIEKHYLPKGEKKGDLFTSLKASQNPKVNEVAQTALDLTFAEQDQRKLRQRLDVLIRDLFTKQKQLVHGPEGIPVKPGMLNLMAEIVAKYGPDVDYDTIAKYYTEGVAKVIATIWDDGKSIDTKHWRLSEEQVEACRRIFGENFEACDPQNIFGKMFGGAQ